MNRTKSDISAIILVGREELHIRRCLEKLAPLVPEQVFVVESQQGDRTHEMANEMGVTTVWHDWPGMQSVQFNWALDNLPIRSSWILRLDADEYLTEDTIERLRLSLKVGGGEVSPDVCGLTLELKRRFCGGEIHHATNGIRQVRLFRRGKGRYAETLMDEHLILGDWLFANGKWSLNQAIKQRNNQTIDFDGAFYDDNLNTMDWWREKHRGYAKREAAQAIECMRSGEWSDPRKARYYRLPRYLRAFLYFSVRYFLKGGILDGYAGWMWNFWQGFWYRLLVDWEIGRK